MAAVRWCAKAATKPIIADGGIRDHGDIAKSIRFGATMVMIGSLFAGHQESPGEEKIVDGQAVKEYFGSASEFQKGERKNVEGSVTNIPRGATIHTNRSPSSFYLQHLNEETILLHHNFYLLNNMHIYRYRH